MADTLYEASWPDLPIELQKYFIVMIGNAQQPLYYHGFGMAILNLQTFTKVSKLLGFQIVNFQKKSSLDCLSISVASNSLHILYAI